MKNILISIIVPVYNVQDCISDCIQSILSQTYQNLEIILVDDCSQDLSVPIAEAILKTSSIVWKVIKHDINKGLSAARNTGVKHATGKYIFFLDSDDFLSDHCLNSLLTLAETKQAQLVCGNYIKHYNNHLIPAFATRKETSPLQYNPLLAHIEECSAPMAWNKLILKNWYDSTDVKFIEGILHEDEPWSLSLALRCKKIEYCNEITYFYRIRSGSIIRSTQNTSRSIEGKISFLQQARSEINHFKRSLPVDYYIWFNKMIWLTIDNIYRSNIENPKPYLSRILSLATSQKFTIFCQLPYTEQKIFFTLKWIFPRYLAFKLACKLNGAIQRINKLFHC